MNARLRRQRNEFLVFLGGTYVSLMCALPIITASLAVQYPRSAPALAAQQPGFEQFDRNRDGYVDRAEALALEDLDRVFNEADRRPDGRLDKVEFGRALGLITDRAAR
jgi:hypothetical protein